MGRRKSSKPVAKKARMTLATSFDCPFCNHEKSVECRMHKKTLVGVVECGMCGAKFQSNITKFSEPIDVYTSWIDECEKERENAAEEDDEEEEEDD